MNKKILKGVAYSLILSLFAPTVAYSSVVPEKIVTEAEQVNPLKIKVNIDLEKASIDQFFKKLREASGDKVSFVYSPNDLAHIRGVSLTAEGAEIGELLDEILKAYPTLSYSVEGSIITIKRKNIAPKPVAVAAKNQMQGFVLNEQGKPVVGATVLIVGTTKGAITDDKGHFSIDAKVGEEIEISYMGMVTRSVKITSLAAPLSIILKNNLLAIDEVQVVAYGTSTKRGATGSISVVKADEIKGIPSSSVSNLLQGRVAGMDVTNISGAPGGGGTQVTIRGYNSLSMESGRRFSNPLWVVDGVPMNSFTSPVTGTNALADLNPETIESIQVLKDASATSLYGSRAANGVILVTTKKGYKNQNAQFSVNFSQSFSFLPEYPTVYGGRGERAHRMGAYRNMTSAFYDSDLGIYRYPNSYEEAYHNNSKYDEFWGNGQSSSNDGNELQDSLNSFYNNSTDFFKYYYQTGKITNANVQTFGGGERTTYSIGGGYYGEDGILKGSAYDRINLMGNFSVNPLKYLTVDFRTSLSYSDRSKGGNKSSSLGRGNDIETIPGDAFSLSTLLPGNNPAVESVLTSLQSMTEKNNSLRLRSTFGLKVDILKNLSVSSNVSLDYSQNTRNLFIPSHLNEFNRSSTTGELSRDMMILNENLINYSFELSAGHSFELMLGQSYQYDTYNYIGGQAENGPSDLVQYATKYGWPNLITESNGEVRALKNFQSDFTEKKMASLFGRINYNYKQKYMLTATIRRDGSSVFGSNVRWATFPSVAVAWNFFEEGFMQGLNFLDFGKIRASYGLSGNQFSNPYLAYGVLSGGAAYNGNPTILPDWKSGYYNPDLTWEETKQLDIGFDLAFFKNRLTFTADYYYRVTGKMLLESGIPGNYSGYSRIWRNGASLLNEGIEFDFKYAIFDSEKAYWNVGLNFANNWNKFYKSYNNRDINVSDQASNSRSYILGKSVGEIYGYKTQGYYQNASEVPFFWNEYGTNEPLSEYGDSRSFFKPGDYKIKDINGDGEITSEDNVYLGSSLPKLYGGIVSEVKFKNFDLNLLLSYSFGRDMVYMGASNSVITLKPMGPIFEDLGNVTFWEKPGDNPDYFKNQSGKSIGILDKMVQKVNYIKLKTLTLGYTLPKGIAKKICLTDIRAFVSAENLFTITNYKGGLDPETVDINTGLDDGRAYPLARKFTLGLTVKF